MFLLWNTTLNQQTAALRMLFKFIVCEVMLMLVIAPHSLNFKLDVGLLLVQITVLPTLFFFSLNDVPSVFLPHIFYVFFPSNYQEVTSCAAHMASFLSQPSLSDHM